MAITLGQQPATPNYSYGELVYTATSDQVNQQEFSFVIEIRLGGTLIESFRKQPNPNGALVVDLQKVINDNLTYDLGPLGATTTSPVNGVNGSGVFGITLREEYRIGNVLTIQTGEAFTNVTVIKGFREFNQGNLDDTQIDSAINLSLLPVSSRIHRDDTLVVSYYNPSSNSVLHEVVAIPSSGSTYSDTINGTTYDFDIYDEKSFLGEVRFAWINRKGGWEFFSTTQEQTTNVNVNKQNYGRPVIDFVGATSSNREADNVRAFRSSSVSYNAEFDEVRSVNTQFLGTQEEADRVSGVFDAQIVFIQDGSNYIPVEVTNGYEVRNQARIQPNFNYTIQYRYRNNKRGY